MRFPALATLPGLSTDRDLCRMVARAALEAYDPPNFLFVSGNAGRFNSPGVECIYASEDHATAAEEYRRYNVGDTKQAVLFWIHVSGLVLDLSAADTLNALGLTNDQLFLPWRPLSVPTSTITQNLGDAVAQQTRIAGIRYPSDAARARNFTGHNYVFFRPSVIAPASVVVKDDKGAEIQAWP